MSPCKAPVATSRPFSVRLTRRWFRTCSGDTGGILNEGGPVLDDSIVRENEVTTGVGGGIYSSSSKPLTIRNSVITENRATNGGGIFLRGAMW